MLYFNSTNGLITNISHLIIRNKYQQVKMKINLVIFDYYLQ